MSSPHSQISSSSLSSPLNIKNYLNVVAFIINFAVAYGIGVSGANEYQTLITPIGWAFSIWGLIFLSQLIFVIVQLLPRYRNVDLVQKGVSYYYVGVCLAQALWIIVFSNKIIWLSLLFMITILFFLALIVATQYSLDDNDYQEVSDGDGDENVTSVIIINPINAFWLLKFPFAIHTGWIVAATFVNINILFVDLNATSSVQLGVAIVSLIGLLLVSIYLLIVLGRRPQYTIPCVLVWATAGIWAALGNPKESITNTFTQTIIVLIRKSACISSSIISLLVLIAAIRQKRHSSSSSRRNDINSSAGERTYLKSTGANENMA